MFIQINRKNPQAPNFIIKKYILINNIEFFSDHYINAEGHYYTLNSIKLKTGEYYQILDSIEEIKQRIKDAKVFFNGL